MGEIKQANFRIDEDSAKAFRKFCDENGMNQAQGFDHLIQVLELEQAKAVIPERLTEIETFEQNIKAVQEGFLKSLEIAKNTEGRVLEQFKGRLDSQNMLIAKLQKENQENAEIAKVAEEKVLKIKQEMELAKERANVAETSVANQQEHILWLEKEVKKLNDFEKLQEVWENQKKEVAELKIKLNDSLVQQEKAVVIAKQELAETVNSLKLDLAIANTKITEKEANLEKAEKKINVLEKEIADLRAKNVELTLKLEQKN